MEKDIKKEALRQYLKYFKVWFIIAGILAVITIGAAVVHLLTPKTVRGNSQDPTERVFDYADMLTDEEEQILREYIAECEEKIQADIVIVTISESVEYDLQNPGLAEAFHAKEVGSTDWSTAMRDLADNFYDYNNFGYDKVHGTEFCCWTMPKKDKREAGCLPGNVYDYFGDYEIDQALYAVDDYIDESPYKAYKNCISYVTRTMEESKESMPMTFSPWILTGLVVALIYAAVNLHQRKAKDTTTVNQYLDGKKPKINNTRDQYLRKNVVTRRIETSSSSSGHSSGAAAVSAMAAVAIEDKITSSIPGTRDPAYRVQTDTHTPVFSFYGGRSDGGKQ